MEDDHGKGRSQKANGAQRASKHSLQVNTQEDAYQTGKLGFTSVCHAVGYNPGICS